MKKSLPIGAYLRCRILLPIVIIFPQFVSGQQWEIYTAQNSDMPDNMLGLGSELSVDGEDNLWIVHQQKGVVKYSQENDEWTYFHAENSPLPDNSKLTTVIADGLFAWATNYSEGDSQGVYEFDGTAWKTLTAENGGDHLLLDKNKDLWFAKLLFGGPSLHKYDYSEDFIIDKSSSLPIPPPHTSVLSEMAIDSEGKIWMVQVTSLGPDKSVLFMIDESITYDETDCDIFNHAVLKVEIAPNDDLWLGSVAGGDTARGIACLRKNTGEWETYHTGNSPLPGDHILDLKSDAQNRIWIGTYRGLAMFEGSDWTVYTRENSPLPSDTVVAIDIDSYGAKWVTTPKALVRLSEVAADFESTDCSLYVSFADHSQTHSTSVASWQWDFAGLGTSDAQNPDFAFPEAGVYSVALHITDNLGNRDRVSKDITVGDPENPLQLGPDIDSCEPSIALSANISDATDYEWTLPAGEMIEGEVQLTVHQSGTYLLSVSTPEGCSYRDTVNVTLNHFTTTEISIGAANSSLVISDSIYTGTSVTFSTPGDSISWDLGNGIISSANPVTLSYSQPGAYPVILSAGMDDRGCPVMAERILVVSDIFVANAMTPNGDGKNDVLIVEPMLDQASLKVLNRWGQVVYSGNLDEGAFDGKNLESGVYFYELRFRNFNNVYTGNLHIIK